MGVSPEPSSREAAVRLLGLLSVMDTHMSNRKDAQLGWLEISIALGLDSTRGKTITMIASEVGLSKQAISKRVTTFLRMSQLPPAFGLKSETARRVYQQTNGHSARSD